MKITKETLKELKKADKDFITEFYDEYELLFKYIISELFNDIYDGHSIIYVIYILIISMPKEEIYIFMDADYAVLIVKIAKIVKDNIKYFINVLVINICESNHKSKNTFLNELSKILTKEEYDIFIYKYIMNYNTITISQMINKSICYTYYKINIIDTISIILEKFFEDEKLKKISFSKYCSLFNYEKNVFDKLIIDIYFRYNNSNYEALYELLQIIFDKLIKKYSWKSNEQDDFYQEALLIIHNLYLSKAIKITKEYFQYKNSYYKNYVLEKEKNLLLHEEEKISYRNFILCIKIKKYIIVSLRNLSIKYNKAYEKLEFNDEIVNEYQDKNYAIEISKLTKGEQEIINLLKKNYSVKEISKIFNISTQAIYKKIKKIKTKL